jgi:hypothetical protein
MSSSKVRDQEAKRTEARRVQERMDKTDIDKKTDQNRAAKFSSLVKNQDKKNLDSTKQTTKHAGEQNEQTLRQADQGKQMVASRNARMARGGMMQHSRIMDQAKSFHQALEGSRTETKSDKDVKVKDRSEGMTEAREAFSERASEIDDRLESQKEVAKEEESAEIKDKERINAAIEGAAEKGDGGSQKNRDDSHQESASQAVEQGAAVDAPKQAGYTSGVQQIPEAILEKLASNVWMGVNEKGMSTFRIELKDGVLQGASVQVSADGGKISLTIEGLDGGARNLVMASRGSLMRKLESKGLQLEEISVPAPKD